ncbi:MAG: hypothetical protein HQK83_12750 [Fibrobacteria bacterium]|nr:hypothetical protein [Fibrobacteria bacterium]
MITKSILRIINIGLLICSIMLLANCKEKTSSENASAKTSKTAEAASFGPELAESTNAPVQLRYFFSNSHRCASCKKIENLTKRAVQENFAQELENGTMSFLLVDMDKDEHKPLIEKYKLFTKSVVVSVYDNGKEVKWQNLEKIWTLLNNEEAFKAYIAKEVKSFLSA